MGKKTVRHHLPVKTLRDILTPHVITLAPDACAEEAIAIMRKRRISCIVVTEQQQPVGIFTERNLVDGAHRAVDFAGTNMRALMSSPVVTAPSSTTIYDAFNLFSLKKIRHLVVVNAQGHISGVITQSDLIAHLGIEYFVEAKKVGKIMNRTVQSIPAGSLVRDALARMHAGKMSCVFIAEKNIPFGILTERDMTRLIYEKHDLNKTVVEEVMSSPIRTVASDAPLHEAIQAMKQHRIRRLGVTAGDGMLTGVITQSDIVRGMEGRYTESLREIVREKEEQLQAALSSFREKSAYLDSIMRSSTDSAIIATDIKMTVKYCNPAAEQMLEIRANDMIGERIQNIAQKGIDHNCLVLAFDAVKRNEEYQFSIQHSANARSRSLECRVSGIRTPEHVLAGYVLILRDVTERRQLEEQLTMAATIDKLTGAFNRHTFEDLLDRERSRAQRHKSALSLIMADIDHFKKINDTHGHQTGDKVLQSVADIIRQSIRRSDMLGRWGGEEFMILAPETTAVNATALAEKLRRNAEDCEFPLFNRVTISMGVTALQHDDSVETLIARVDAALYDAKHNGRNRVEAR